MTQIQHDGNTKFLLVTVNQKLESLTLNIYGMIIFPVCIKFLQGNSFTRPQVAYRGKLVSKQLK